MEFPRLALATHAGGPDPSIAALAMLAGLTERRSRVQHFRTIACPTTTECVGQVSGLPGRHLDAWLMPHKVVRKLFARGARFAELSLVEGTLDGGGLGRPLDSSCDRPGYLRPIAEALDTPVVAVVSCASWLGDGSIAHLPPIPERVDAVILDQLTDRDNFDSIRRLIQLTRGIPVLGAIETLPAIRDEFHRAPRHGMLAEDSVRALARSFLRYADLGAIRELAESRPFPGEIPVSDRCGSGLARTRVAYAHDDAFGRYFPDTLEAIEALGADLIEFSPIHDEELPDDIDLVMIGCGFPDQFVDELSANASMIASLRAHVCRGKRIYSEGGGSAYLGRSMILPDRRLPGVGILPFHAELLPDAGTPIPVTRTLTHDSWLGPQGTVVRGYRSCRWKLTPSHDPFDCPSCYGSLTADWDFSFRHHAVGSLIHLHLGALPEVVAAFAGPHRPSLRRPSA